MAIVWGSYDGYLAVGIDVSISGTTVTVRYYVKTSSGGYNWSDTQTLNRTNWITGSTSYFNDLTGPSEQMLVATVTKTGSRGSSYTVGAYITGAFNGNSPSVSRSFTVPAIAPSAPGTPSFSDVTGTSMKVSWSAPSSNGGATITNYRLQYSTTSDFSSDVHTFNTGTSRTKTVTGLTPGVRYYWRVRAENSAGDGDYSSTSNKWTLDYADPVTLDPVTDPAADSANLTWSATPDNGGASVTGYVVQFDTDPAFSDPTELTTGTTRALTIGGLTPGDDYNVRVAPVTSVGQGDWSNVVTFTTPAGFKVWSGAAFLDVLPLMWDGAEWVDAPPLSYDDMGQWVVPV